MSELDPIWTPGHPPEAGHYLIWSGHEGRERVSFMKVAIDEREPVGGRRQFYGGHFEGGFSYWWERPELTGGVHGWAHPTGENFSAAAADVIVRSDEASRRGREYSANLERERGES